MCSTSPAAYEFALQMAADFQQEQVTAKKTEERKKLEEIQNKDVKKDNSDLKKVKFSVGIIYHGYLLLIEVIL